MTEVAVVGSTTQRGVLARRVRIALLLVWPSAALLGLIAIPVAMLAAISLAPHDASRLWAAGVTLQAYGALVDPEFLGTLVYSIGLAALIAAISLGLGFPLTWFVTGMGRRSQVAWLVFLLATLSLSDVLIAFSWQVMLSKRIGLSNILVSLRLMAEPDSLAPGGGAVIACLIYLVMPFTVLTLYPALSRLDRTLIEAARTLGATPFRAFCGVVLPLARGPAVNAFVVSAVLTLGAYVPPMVLGKPQGWTVAVLIGNAALAGHDLPRAAAMSIGLLAAALPLAFGAMKAAGGRRAR